MVAAPLWTGIITETSGIGSDFGAVRARRARGTRRDESLQVAIVSPGRRRFVVEHAREASARVVAAAFVDQHAAEMAQHLDPRAAKAVDQSVGRRAVAFAHQLDEQIAFGLALERLGIERARFLAHKMLGDAAEVAVLARAQQEVEILARRDEAFVEAAGALEHVAPYDELARHDVPRMREHFVPRGRLGAVGPRVGAHRPALGIDFERERVDEAQMQKTMPSGATTPRAAL